MRSSARRQPRPRFGRATAILFATVTASACDVQPIEDGPGSEIPPSVQAAFDDACATSGCHSGSSPSAGLNLSAGASDAILTATSSTGVPLVEIGNLYNSYLALKVLPPSAIPASAPSVSGDVMPLGGPRPQAVATIVAWVSGVDVSELEGEGGTPCYGPENPPPDVSFGEHVYPVLQNGCILAGCHTEAMNELLLPPDDAAGAYDLLVDVPSVSMGEAQAMDPSVVVFDYVEPGAPDTSYLWHKIAGSQKDVLGGGGRSMPISGPLCAEDVRLVYRWVLSGAAP